jgi:hypothetical protein
LPDALAAYARTAKDPVKRPATAAPVMTALDGFIIYLVTLVEWAGFRWLKWTRLEQPWVSRFVRTPVESETVGMPLFPEDRILFAGDLF